MEGAEKALAIYVRTDVISQVILCGDMVSGERGVLWYICRVT